MRGRSMEMGKGIPVVVDGRRTLVELAPDASYVELVRPRRWRRRTRMTTHTHTHTHTHRERERERERERDVVTPHLLQKGITENFDFHVILRHHQSYKIAAEYIYI